MKRLELENIRFSYNNDEFIKDLSFSLHKGEFVGLIGPNGAGKSTLLKLSSGILKPLSGAVKILRTDIFEHSPKQRAKLVAYLPQTLHTLIPFRVEELVEMGLYAEGPGITPKDAIEIVGLKGKKDSYLTQLSGGERQRAFIAMLLTQGSKVLLLDEPLANLDIKYQLELVRLLKDIVKGKDVSVAIALHDLNMALQLENICVMKEGKIHVCGNPKEIISSDLIKDVFEIDAGDLYWTPFR